MPAVTEEQIMKQLLQRTQAKFDKYINVVNNIDINIKTESIRKLSNFNFQWTKTLYQNNLKHIAFFFTFSQSYGCNLLSVITSKTISYGSPRK